MSDVAVSSPEDKRSKNLRYRGRRWRRRLTAAQSAMDALERIKLAIEADDGSAAGVLNEYIILVGNRIEKAVRKLHSIDVKVNVTPSSPINALVALGKSVKP